MSNYDLSSPAGIKNQSNIHLTGISPKESKFKTVGMTMNRKEAVKLARNILILTEDVETDGDIVLTAFRKTMRSNPTTYRHFKKVK